MKRIVLLFSLAATVLAAAAPAEASRFARYGIQDDAWLQGGPGTVEERLDLLDSLGVDVVRYTLRWDKIAARKPTSPRWSGDPAYQWGAADAILKGLRARGIGAVVTLLGTPRWANGGLPLQYPPAKGQDFANFATAAANRFPWVRDWTIWNEPNKRLWFRPQSARLYVQRLLNPAHTALKAANRSNRVAGGVTAPRGGVGGTSPVAWIRAMDRWRPRMDAYAHNPYPTRPWQETPRTGGCSHCATVTMATLERLIREVRRAFGNKRIWLTEYGYQTRPEDRTRLGVTKATAARYVSSAAQRVYAAPYVDMLIHFLVRDDSKPGGWQSGFINTSGSAKPTLRAWQVSLAQSARRGLRTTLWGQIKPRAGRQPYRLRQFRGGRWVWVGGTRWTNARGAFARVVRAGRGAKFQVWSPRDKTYSVIWTVR